MAKQGLSIEKYRQVKKSIKSRGNKTLKIVASEEGIAYSTLTKIKVSKNYKDYKENFCRRKTSQDKLEEFLKNPNTNESLERLIERFLEDERSVKKIKPSFWQRIKNLFNK